MRALLISLLLFPTLWLQEAHASATDWQSSEETRARLVAGNLLETGMRRAGIEIELKKDWHTYWRTPGDGGMAPSIDWSKSKNVKSVEFLLPAPTRYAVTFEGFAPVDTYGYADHVVFPLLVTPENPAYTTELDVSVKYAVCKELCVFLDDHFNLRISNNHVDEDTTKRIDAALVSVPGKSEGLGIGAIKLDEAAKTLEVNITSEKPFVKPDIFVEVTPDFRFAAPQIFFTDDRKSALAKLTYVEKVEGKHINGLKAIVTLTDDGKGAEASAMLGQAAEVPAKAPFEQPAATVSTSSDTSDTTTEKSILYILIAAFIGGLILNIMPCVLPVLSLKLLGIARHGGGSSHHVRASFLASAAGIIASFLVLAAIVIALRSAGTAVGWGFHFQQPAFVIGLVIVINLFAASQWGLMEINLPSWLGGSLSKLTPEGDDHSLTGHFMTGVLATVLATPCSAPYLGTAVGFALSQGDGQIALVFAVMGLGLAAPYLVFTLFPSLITRLPKPGAWMLKVKHFMGYLLAATSIWLIWVLSMQLGPISACVVAAFSVSGILLLYYHKIRPIAKTLLALMLVAGLAATFALPEMLAEKTPEQGTPMEKAMWQPFDEAAIPALVAQGKTVFVDVTADWCLTCKFNKIHVLYVGKAHEALMQENVVTMKADYTNPRPEIAAYLKKNGRYGIPFNIVYGPNAPEGIPLSEYLKEEDVLAALDKAGKNAP